MKALTNERKARNSVQFSSFYLTRPAGIGLPTYVT